MPKITLLDRFPYYLPRIIKEYNILGIRVIFWNEIDVLGQERCKRGFSFNEGGTRWLPAIIITTENIAFNWGGIALCR